MVKSHVSDFGSVCPVTDSAAGQRNNHEIYDLFLQGSHSSSPGSVTEDMSDVSSPLPQFSKVVLI